jgi:hypothetical protein
MIIIIKKKSNKKKNHKFFMMAYRTLQFTNLLKSKIMTKTTRTEFFEKKRNSEWRAQYPKEIYVCASDKTTIIPWAIIGFIIDVKFYVEI